MTRPAPLLLLLLLAGCGGTPRPAPAPENPQVAACRAEARSNAGGRDVSRELNMANPNQMEELRQRRADAEQRAFNDCLRARGLSRGGGVEAVRPSFSLF